MAARKAAVASASRSRIAPYRVMSNPRAGKVGGEIRRRIAPASAHSPSVDCASSRPGRHATPAAAAAATLRNSRRPDLRGALNRREDTIVERRPSWISLSPNDEPFFCLARRSQGGIAPGRAENPRCSKLSSGGSTVAQRRSGRGHVRARVLQPTEGDRCPRQICRAPYKCLVCGVCAAAQSMSS